MQPKSNQKAVVSVIIVGILLVLVLTVYTIFERAGRQAVVLSLVPSDARVTLGDGRDIGRGEHLLEHGLYSAEVSRPNFTTQEVEFEVTEATDRIGFGLLPANQDGEKYFQDHPDERLSYESVGGIESQRSGKELVNLYPFARQLPRISLEDYYAIDYGATSETDVGAYFVIGNSATSGRINAIDWLSSSGADISITDIRYDDYVSPLTDRQLSERGY